MKEYVLHVVEVVVSQTRRYTVDARDIDQAEELVEEMAFNNEDYPHSVSRTEVEIVESFPSEDPDPGGTQ